MTDYSKTPLFKKLGYKDNFKVYLIDPPGDYLDLIKGFPLSVTFPDNPKPGEQDIVHLFASDIEGLENSLGFAKSLINKSGMVWVSWPKQSSKADSDLNGNYVRNSGLSIGLVDSKVCSVNDTWSGLKFVYRKADR